MKGVPEPHGRKKELCAAIAFVQPGQLPAGKFVVSELHKQLLKTTRPNSLVIVAVKVTVAVSCRLRGYGLLYEFQDSNPKTLLMATWNIWLVWTIGPVESPGFLRNSNKRLTKNPGCMANSLKLGK